MKKLAEEVKSQLLTCFPYAGISLIRFNGSHCFVVSAHIEHSDKIAVSKTDLDHKSKAPAPAHIISMKRENDGSRA